MTHTKTFVIVEGLACPRDGGAVRLWGGDPNALADIDCGSCGAKLGLAVVEPPTETPEPEEPVNTEDPKPFHFARPADAPFSRLSPSEAVHQAIGAASVCHDEAGVFDSDRARAIAEALLDELFAAVKEGRATARPEPPLRTGRAG